MYLVHEVSTILIQQLSASLLDETFHLLQNKFTLGLYIFAGHLPLKLWTVSMK